MKEFTLTFEALENLEQLGKKWKDLDFTDETDLAKLYYCCANYSTTPTEVLGRIFAQDIKITVPELMKDLTDGATNKAKKKEMKKELTEKA